MKKTNLEKLVFGYRMRGHIHSVNCFKATCEAILKDIEEGKTGISPMYLAKLKDYLKKGLK